MPGTECSTTLPEDAARLLAEYYRYEDLAEHLRALREAAEVIGKAHVSTERDDTLAELEAQILARLERLDALGLYPTTTTAIDVTVNGVPIALPDLCRESTTNALPNAGSPTKEISMHTAIESSDLHEQHNGLDRSLETSSNGAGFFASYVRPYLGYTATFAAGAVCGVVGARYFSGDSEGTQLSG